MAACDQTLPQLEAGLSGAHTFNISDSEGPIWSRALAERLEAEPLPFMKCVVSEEMTPSYIVYCLRKAQDPFWCCYYFVKFGATLLVLLPELQQFVSI